MKHQPYRFNLGADSVAKDLVLEGLERFNVEQIGAMAYADFQLGLAEEQAQARGCKGVFLYTYSFQAPGFYQKHGYQLMGVLEDCPPGHQRYYLKKLLV